MFDAANPKNEMELKESIVRAPIDVSLETCQNTVGDFPKRLKMCADSGGGVFLRKKAKLRKEEDVTDAFLETSDPATWIWTPVWNPVTLNWTSMIGTGRK